MRSRDSQPHFCGIEIALEDLPETVVADGLQQIGQHLAFDAGSNFYSGYFTEQP
jgi:hypothetical protein